MRDLEEIFELTDSILPKGANRIVFFCEIEEESHEIFYYATFSDNKSKQCYELAEQGEIDESILDKVFDKIADFIRTTSSYDSQSRNIVTIEIEGSKENVKIEKVSKDVGLYKIKKEWKEINLKK